MTKEANRRIHTAEFWLHFQASEIYDEQSTRQNVLFNYFVHPWMYHSTNAPYSFNHLSPTPYNLVIRQYPEFWHLKHWNYNIK